MDEQSRRIIEAFAKMREVRDPDEIMLAARKVRTQEGVQKYDQPIGTVITKDMIDKAAKKAAQAATESLKKDSGTGTKGAASSSGSAAPSPSTPSSSPAPVAPTSSKLTAVPGGQTTADIKQFLVTGDENNPSAATVGWVEKVDGQWYMQKYVNGKIISETPQDKQQVNALKLMAEKGFVTNAHVPDPEPESPEKSLAKNVMAALNEGKTTADPDVKSMIDKLAAKGVDPEAEKPKPEGKTVKINGKDVKVGRYSRPKGFAKAFLIVNEDGTIEYEDKKGARKKITAKSFENHQSLGMNKFLTSDTAAIKKDEHFEDGKLVKDEGSASKPEAAKVAPMKTPEAAPKPAPVAEKPAQEAPKTTTQPQAESKPAAQESEPKTVKIGNLTVKPGRYARPKGFAKAFLIVHPDGTAEYENKKGERKKIGPKSFEGHWNLGMNKFLTSDTGAMKKGDSYEDGKLVGDQDDSKTEDAPAAVAPTSSVQGKSMAELAQELKAKQAAKDAVAALKAKQEKEEADKKAKEDAEAAKVPTKTILIGQTTEVEVPEDSIVYVNSEQVDVDKVGVIYYKKDGEWWRSGAISGTKKVVSQKDIQLDFEEGAILPWKKYASKKDFKSETLTAQAKASTKKITVKSAFNDATADYDIPADSVAYVGSHKENSVDVSKAYVKHANGSWESFGIGGGKQPVPKDTEILLEKYIQTGNYVKWKAFDKKVFSISMGTGDNRKSYDVPEGTKVYVTKSLGANDSPSTVWLKYPDGDWWKIGQVSGLKKVNPVAQTAMQETADDGFVVPWEKYTPVEAPEAKSADGSFYVMIKGAKIAAFPKGSKVYYMPHFKSAEEASVKFVKDPDGKWSTVTSSGAQKANEAETDAANHAEAVKMMKLETSSEKDGQLTPEDDGTNVNIVPTDAEKSVEKDSASAPSAADVKSVKISGMDIKPGKYSIGKGFAKAFLLVHPDGKVEYQNKAGDKKKLTVAAFKKNWDAGMNKYAGPLDGAAASTEPAVKPNAEPTNVGGPKPGTYDFMPFGQQFQKKSLLEVLPDGSSKFTVPDSGTEGLPADAAGTLNTFKSGMVVDEFGNSVVLPGLPAPEKVHLFGASEGASLYALKILRDDLAAGKSGIMTMVKDVAGKDLQVEKFFAYQKKHFPVHEEGSARKSFIKAIDDILHAAQTNQTEASAPAAIPNVTKGLFTFDSNGYAVMPKEVVDATTGFNFGYLTASEQNAIIKKISAAFGDGKILSPAPSKMSTYTKQHWFNAFLKGDFKSMYSYEINVGMKTPMEHPGSPDNKDTNQINWSAAVAGEMPAGVKPPGKWTYDPYSMSDAEVDNYLIAANMAYPQYLGASDRRYWVMYHVQGKKPSVDKLSLKAKTRFEQDPNYTFSTPPVWTDGIKPKNAYDDYVDMGTPVSGWTEQAIDAYVEDFPDAISAGDKGKPAYQLVKPLQNYLDTQAAEKAAKEAAELAEKLKPKFKKAAGFSVSGGHHETMVLEDQFGKKWVYKPRDDKDIFLADVEQASHDLAHAWGYKTARSFITDFDGRKGHVQEMFDAKSDMGSVSMSSLTPAQVKDLAKEHLLDWALDNDDSWSANVLVLQNDAIVGIDKGRAFASIGHWNGLSADSNAHVHMPLVYTDLYKAIQDKSISQDVANDAYFAVLKQAKKMQSLSDAKMTEKLEAAFANRTNWAVTGGPKNKEEAIEAALKRKNSLVEDMETLWGNVFKKAGYDKPQAPENVVTNPEDQDIHLGVTPAALEAAKENGSYGTAVFFAGPEIEDSHMLLFHAQSKSGRDTLNAEFKIREETQAFKDVEKWLKDNAVQASGAYGYTPPTMKPNLPNEEDYFQKIMLGVKTISAHALDGQYNESSLNGMSWVKNTLQNYLTDFDAKMPTDNGKADLVKQYKDPQAFQEMAKQYLDIIAKAEQHKANGTKSAPGEFTQYVWTPPKEDKPDPIVDLGVKVELRPATSAKAVVDGVPKFEPDGSLKHAHGYTSAGNPGSMYLVTLPTGETIEFRGKTTGTPAASKGLVRWRTAAGADEAASIERIRAQMTTMGLEMKDASEDDLELYYWRHLAAIMNDRADSKVSPGVSLKSTPKYKKFQAAKPVEISKMSATEELEAWKDAFANITSRSQIDEFVGSGGHLPKFEHFHLKNKDQYSGTPYWERFDVSEEDWQAKQMPSGSFYDNSHAEYIVSTGGMMATETRLRTLGMWKDGMSSSSDQGHGSSQFVFIRQNLEVKDSTSPYDLMHIFYSPKILKRTHNYSFSGDQFGEMTLKNSSSYFDFDEMTSHQGGSNELMVKHAVSLLDSIEIVTFSDASLRKKVIDGLKAMGVDEIRGVPVEKRFVMRNKNDIIEAQKAAKEAWKK